MCEQTGTYQSSLSYEKDGD